MQAIIIIAKSPKELYIICFTAAALIAIKLLLPPYWHFTIAPIAKELPHGVTEEGHPWIGSEDPTITIHEYTDYLCFQCSKMHFFLRQIIVSHPHTIRLVHHNYPMDHEVNAVVVPAPYHIGSGKMALIAIYATERGKFWEMNDELYALGRTQKPFNTKFLADGTGLTPGELSTATKDPRLRAMLDLEIRQGMKLNITGTPTFVVNGKVYDGALPTEVFNSIAP